MIPTGTITFLFTDIEGSTQLWERFPDQMKPNLARHDALLRAAIEQNGGTVFKTVGDAFCAAFPAALQAVKAAIQTQQALAQENWGEAAIKVRIGLHTGDAEQRDNDYFGTTLNRVARLMSAGHGGQVLLSLTTQQLVNHGLPEGITLRSLGEHRLKDLILSEQIYQLVIPGLPAEFPALKTLEETLNNLPTHMTPFIGRQREIAAILGLLRSPAVRMATLTGPGGTGKTRLSLQVAAELLNEFEHGVWLVELASVTEPERALRAIASTLKVKEAAGMTIEQSLHVHLAKRNLLLVLDNFEQLVVAAPKISDLLAAAPGVKVLISSREVLHLRGEHHYPVSPLGLPEPRQKQTAAVLAQFEAVALFVQHARAANPAFELDEENAATVAEICRRLDGLPLAIELAAARSRLFKPAAMLERLNSRLGLLTGGARDLPARQQTMRGAIDWSYELLDEAEKTLFARLGVFVGGWTVEAAQAVCATGLSLDVLSGLESLLDKSLLRLFEGKSGEARFSMLETIREYAFEKLSQSGELATLQQAHAGYFERFLQKVIDELHSPDEAAWFARLDDELDNLRFAVEWTSGQQDLSLIFKIGMLWPYWDQRTNYREPLAWLERGLAIEHTGLSRERARSWHVAGILLMMTGDRDRARQYGETALALYRQIEDTEGIVLCLNFLGDHAWKFKDLEKARQFFEQALAVVQPCASWGQALTLMNLGSLATIRGDYQEALERYLHGRDICLQLGSETDLSYADWYLGRLALAQGNLDEAWLHLQKMQQASWLNANPLLGRFFRGYLGYLHLLSDNYSEARRILDDAIDASLEHLENNDKLPGEGGEAWVFLDGKARLALRDGQFERAARLFGAAWAQCAEGCQPLTAAERPGYEACIGEIRQVLGEAAFDAAFRKGQAMPIQDILRLALGS